MIRDLVHFCAIKIRGFKRVQLEKNVAQSQWYVEKHARRYCVSRAHPMQKYTTVGAWLEASNHRGSSRVRRSGFSLKPESATLLPMINIEFVKYRATDVVIKSAGKLSMNFEPADGSPKQEYVVFNFKSGGVALSMYNTDEVGQKDPVKS